MTDTQLYIRVSHSDVETSAFNALLQCPMAKCVRIDLPTEELYEWQSLIDTIQPVCYENDVALLVSNHINLVTKYDLDGVHLTPTGTPFLKAREIVGRDKIIGAYAGTSRHVGMTLAESGADYVSFGFVWRDPSLSDQVVAEPELFAWWQEMIEVPVVAEGGVTPDHARTLQGCADFIVLEYSQIKTVDTLKDYGF